MGARCNDRRRMRPNIRRPSPKEFVGSHRGGRREEHLEAGTLLSLASPDLEPTVDLNQERLDDPQSQSFVVAKVESVRQAGSATRH